MRCSVTGSRLIGVPAPSSSHRRTRIALLTNGLLTSYPLSFRLAVERAVRRVDCDLVVVLGRELQHPDPNDRAQNVVFDWLSPEWVDGVIFLSGVLVNYTGPAPLHALTERLSSVPCVSIGIELAGIISFVVDNRAGMMRAVEHLIVEHGCRKIAYVGGPPDNQEARARLEGYRAALQAHGLPLSSELETTGNFTLASGGAAAESLIDAGTRFDALVAANDYMAIGAMDVLLARGFAVPSDVRVIGFDDSPSARSATRSLTSVAQSVEDMAEHAVEALLARLSARATTPVTAFAPELVVRESCGCGYVASSISPAPENLTSALDYLRQSEQALARPLVDSALSHRSWWREQTQVLLAGLAAELDGRGGAFLDAVALVLDGAVQTGVAVEDLGRALLRLRESFDAAGYRGPQHFALERLWLQGLLAIASRAARVEGRNALDVGERYVNLRQAAQRVSVALDSESLAAQLGEWLPRLGVGNALVALASAGSPPHFTPILCLLKGAVRPAGPEYPASQLFPKAFSNAIPACLLVMALTFDNHHVGVMALDGAVDIFVCETIRNQVSAALRLGMLHTRVVEETAARERLAQAQLHAEVEIARRLQAALAPRTLAAPRLQITAHAAPADQVGGDYYDVIPTADGCWLAMADVTGHGLLSGLIMLMIQSMTGALVRSRPSASPCELVTDVNLGMTPNIKERLGKEDFATFVLLRYHEDGRVVFAGAHEDLIIYRAALGVCECVEVPGVWIGVVPDISGMLEDHEVRLNPGDLMILVTDGLAEARNAHNEMFGNERICQIVCNCADQPIEQIRQELFSAVRAWAPVQQDDITVLIAAYASASADPR